jgi:hypothetical protein
MALTLKERCTKRLAGLKSVRQPYESDWKIIDKHARPARSRFLYGDTSGTARNTRRSKGVYDSHSIQSFRTLTGGMTSGLSPSSQPWFRAEVYDEAVKDDPEVRAWLDDTQRRMYDFLAATNFYGAAQTGYSELGLFGTDGCVMVEDDEQGAVCHALTVGEYWIALGRDLMANTLYRDATMTVAQAVQSFEWNKLSLRVREQYDRSDYDQLVKIIHAIEPNLDRDPDRKDFRGKPFRSIWWDEQDNGVDALLRESGYEEKPFWAPRWETSGADVYGDSPGMVAIPDMLELQMQTKRKAEAVDFLVKPEKVTGPNVKLTGMPGNVVSAASIDQNTVLVPYQMPYQAIAAIREDVEKCKQAIDAASFADLFMAITNMQGVQPRNIEEIAARNEEKMTQLGPVIDRVNNEKLEVALDRVWGIMSRGGLLMPAPEALQDKEIKFEFVSILTQMQRMVGIGQVERTASFVGNLAAVFPEAVDKLNVDEMIDEYADRAGAPAKMIRSKDQVEEIRQGRAQAQQAEKMAAMMPAAQQGADAARLLSEADTGDGGNLLQRILP